MLATTATAPPAPTRATPTTAPAVGPAPAIAAAPAMVRGTAGDIELAYGDWFTQLGAIGGGEAIGPHVIRLRFDTTAEALVARAALDRVVDGVRILVTAREGGRPYGTAPTADAVAGFLTRLHEVGKVEVRGTPKVLVVTSPEPDVNAHLDVILRDQVRGLPVVWQTAERAPAATAPIAG